MDARKFMDVIKDFQLRAFLVHGDFRLLNQIFVQKDLLNLSKMREIYFELIPLLAVNLFTSRYHLFHMHSISDHEGYSAPCVVFKSNALLSSNLLVSQNNICICKYLRELASHRVKQSYLTILSSTIFRSLPSLHSNLSIMTLPIF